MYSIGLHFFSVFGDIFAMPNEETTTRSAMTAAVFIFLAALLVCPGMLLCVPSWSFRFFETGTIVLAMAGAALLFPQRIRSASCRCTTIFRAACSSPRESCSA